MERNSGVARNHGENDLPSPRPRPALFAVAAGCCEASCRQLVLAVEISGRFAFEEVGVLVY